MAELKTKENDASVSEFLKTIEPENKQEDAFKFLEFYEKATGLKAKMWGGSIIGFGNHRYKYASGKENDWFICGFSPRKQNFAIYIMCEANQKTELLKDVGKHKSGKSCIYFKKFEDVDQDGLTLLLKEALNNPTI